MVLELSIRHSETNQNFYANLKFSSLLLDCRLRWLQHKMFYKTKSTSRRTSNPSTVTTQNDGLSKFLWSIFHAGAKIDSRVNKLDWTTFGFLLLGHLFRIATVLHLFDWRPNASGDAKHSSRSATKVRRRHQRSELRETRGFVGKRRRRV